MNNSKRMETLLACSINKYPFLCCMSYNFNLQNNIACLQTYCSVAVLKKQQLVTHLLGSVTTPIHGSIDINIFLLLKTCFAGTHWNEILLSSQLMSFLMGTHNLSFFMELLEKC